MTSYNFPGPSDLTFISEHKEREDQDVLVYVVK